MIYTVEIALEIDAASPADAAALALLDVRAATDPLRVDVYADEAASGRYWRQILVDVHALSQAASC